MSHFFRTYRAMRAPRVTLQGAVPVVIQLENKRQFTGKLHRLSITGGLLELTSYIDERCKVLMALQLGAGLLQTKAEMMFPMRGGMGYFQPFRFTGFGAGARQTLELQIAELLRRTIGPNNAVAFNSPRLFMDRV
jgi:hypothetical protein